MTGVLALAVAIAFCWQARAQIGTRPESHHEPLHSLERQEQTVKQKAVGTFDVTLVPTTAPAGSAGAPLGRMTMSKQFHGDLEGTSTGEMLTAGTNVKGSAGYVAIERVSGKLDGRTGTFVLQHSGIMSRGKGKLIITIVPDSGTDELEGITGEMSIIIEDGQHSYELNYDLPER
jgi:hypothetical protein